MKGTLLLGHRVLEPESLDSSLLGESVHLFANLVSESATSSVFLRQFRVLFEQNLVPLLNLIQLSEFIGILSLSQLQEILELAKFVGFGINPIMLLFQGCQLIFSNTDISLYAFDFLPAARLYKIEKSKLTSFSILASSRFFVFVASCVLRKELKRIRLSWMRISFSLSSFSRTRHLFSSLYLVKELLIFVTAKSWWRRSSAFRAFLRTST